MNQVIPRPIRDIVDGVVEIRGVVNFARGQEAGSAGAAALGIFGTGFLILPPAEKLIKATARIALVAAAAFALFKSNGSLPVAATIGSLLSLPATAIFAGSGLMCYGAMMTANAVSSGAFVNLGLGLASLGAGYMTLEYHDFFAFGIAESCLINPSAKQFAPTVVRALA